VTRRGWWERRGLGAVVVACVVLAWPGSARAVGPVGALVVDCTGIEGWAQEPDMPDALIDVHLYFNGPAGDPAATAVVVTASQVLDAGCMGAECMHGYRSALPMSLLDSGDHAVHAYGIDLTGDPNLELAGSPAVMSCPPPPIVGGELRHVVSPEILAAWQFSVFFDRLIVADATIMGLVVGPVVDVGPQLRVDAGGGLWVIDQGRRRPLPVEVAPAWRLAPAAAIALTPEELALPEGTELRPRPVLLQGTLPEVYLLDDHQCGPGDPDPSCVPEGEDETGGGESGDAGTSTAADSGSSSGGEESGEVGSDGTGGVVTGLPPAEGDDEAAGCGCTSGGPRGAWGLVMMAAARRRRRRPS
jgi:MYXO-CTERM domain-containing protein